MATAKVRALWFADWFAERVEYAPGVWISDRDLLADFRREHPGATLGPQGMAAQLNFRKVKRSKRGSAFGRLGVRLRDKRAEAMVAAIIEAPKLLVEAPPADPLVEEYRLSPYVGGPAVDMVCLRADDDSAQISARIAGELFVERRRQLRPKEQGGEGRAPAHDDDYRNGELQRAAAAYAWGAAVKPEDASWLIVDRKVPRPTHMYHLLETIRTLWPWDWVWWRPGDPRAMLVKAGALIVAAIERIDRQRAREAQQPEGKAS